jgi:hypothetical protein
MTRLWLRTRDVGELEGFGSSRMSQYPGPHWAFLVVPAYVGQRSANVSIDEHVDSGKLVDPTGRHLRRGLT